MPFPNKINAALPVGREGEFASANMYTSSINPLEAGLITGKDGAIVGRFAWVDDDGVVRNTKAVNNRLAGFVHAHQNALITQFLAESSNVILAGQPIDVMSRGDFWVKTTTAARIGQAVFANQLDGSILTGSASVGVGDITAFSTAQGQVWGVRTAWQVASNGEAGDGIKITTWS